MWHPVTFLKGIGFGAGLMYLFDPDRGNQRRALLRDQVSSAVGCTEDCIETAVRDLNNRLTGFSHELRAMTSGEQPDDRTLAERIRSTMGRYVSHPRAIDVQVQQGCAVLSGPILADEAQGFVRAVKGVRGVQGVENQLEVHHSAEGVSALQGGTPRQGQRFELMQDNWSPGTRLAATSLGALLMAGCLIRRSPTSLLMGTLGLGLFVRGTSNEPMRRLAGYESQAERGPRHTGQPGGNGPQASHREGEATFGEPLASQQ
jgi:hypothetical protein